MNMEELKYTNEFLKNLEAVIKKEPEVINGVKIALENITNEASQKFNETIALQNIKTYSNQDIFMTKIDYEKEYNIFWTEENSQKIIIALINNSQKGHKKQTK